MISIIISISSFGLMMIYFILFADISRSLVLQIAFDSDEDTKNFFASKAFFVLVMAVLMLPFVV